MSEKVYRVQLQYGLSGQESYDQMINSLEALSQRAQNITVNISEVGKTGEVSLNRMARSFLRIGFMVNMLESALMRMEMANYMVANAQDAYNDALRRHGPASEEAQRAQRRLNQMIDYTHKANMRANISTALLTTQIILQSGVLKKATLAKIAHQTTIIATTAAHYAEIIALKAKAAAQIFLQALSGPAGWATLGAGLAIGAMATYAVVRPQAVNNVNVVINQEGDLDSAFEQAKRQATYELRRSGGV